MRVFVLSFLLVASFVACCMTVVLMNWAFFFSLAIFFGATAYINRHRKDLDSELDEIFGRDQRF